MSSPTASDEVSFDYVSDVNPSLECAICRTAFYYPVMSPACQHIFCHRCINRALELSPTCPVDRTPLRLDQLVNAPRIIVQMVEELKVHCPNSEMGCTAQCERGLLNGHLRDECKFKSSSGHKGKQRELQSTPATIPKSPGRNSKWTRCLACNEKLLDADYQLHEEKCPEAVVSCPHCSERLHRSSQPSHLLQCLSVPIPCPHARHGCSVKVSRSLMEEEHLDVTCPYEPLKEYLNRIDSRLVEVEGENVLLRRRCENLEDGMRETRLMMETVKATLGEFWTEPTQSNHTELRGNRMSLSPIQIERAHRVVGSAPSSPQDLWTDIDRGSLSPLDMVNGSSVPAISVRSSSLPLSGSLIPPPVVVNTQPSLSSPTPYIHPHSNSPNNGFAFDSYYNSERQPPLLAQSQVSPSDPQSSAKSMSDAVRELSQSIQNLAGEMSGLEGRQSTALMNETIRIQDDVGSVRGVVHGMRMQMHYLMMEVSRLTGQNGGMGGVGGMGIGMGMGMGMGMGGAMGLGSGLRPEASGSDGADSNSDDDQPHNGPGMLSRFRFIRPPIIGGYGSAIMGGGMKL